MEEKCLLISQCQHQLTQEQKKELVCPEEEKVSQSFCLGDTTDDEKELTESSKTQRESSSGKHKRQKKKKLTEPLQIVQTLTDSFSDKQGEKKKFLEPARTERELISTKQREEKKELTEPAKTARESFSDKQKDQQKREQPEPAKSFPPSGTTGKFVRQKNRWQNRTPALNVHVYNNNSTLKKMELRDRLFILHFVYCVLIFICVLSSTVSDYWSLSKHAFHGLFNHCHVISFCTDEQNKTAIYRVIQFFQVIFCISAISSVAYCFISILLRRYIENKLHMLSIFYIIQTITGSGTLVLYILLVHNKLQVAEKRYGWALYIAMASTALSLLGLFFSFVVYKRQRNSSVVVRMEQKEMKYHQKTMKQST